MKKELHIVVGTKGGIGRSTIAMLIARVIQAKIINTNTSFSDFDDHKIETIPHNNYTAREESLLHPEATVQLIFEDIFTYFQENDGKIVLDVSSPLTIPFFYFSEDTALEELCKLFEEGEINLFLHGIVGGNEWSGNEKIVEKLNNFSSTFQNKTLWVNNFFIKNHEENSFLPLDFLEDKHMHVVHTPFLQVSTREIVQKSISDKINFLEIRELKTLSIIKKSILNIYYEFYKKEINKIIERATLTPRAESENNNVLAETKEVMKPLEPKSETLISSHVKENQGSLIFSLARKVEKRYFDGEDEPLTPEEITYIEKNTEEAFIKVSFQIKKNKTSLQEDISNENVKDFLSKGKTTTKEIDNQDELVFYGEDAEYEEENNIEEEQ